MGLIGFLWFVVGVASLVGFVWLCVLAFKEHIGWGLAVFFLSPVAAVIFGIKFWQDSKKPFLICAGSTVAFFVLAIFTFSAMGGFQMMSMAQRMSQGEEISDEEAAGFIQAQIERMEDSGLLSAEEEAELRETQQMIKNTQNEQGGGEEIDNSTIALASPPTRGSGHDPSGTVSTRSPGTRSTAVPRQRDRSQAPATGDPVPPGYKRVSLNDADRYVGRTIRIVNKDGHQTKGRLADVDSEFLLVERHLTSGKISFELSTSEVDSLLVAYR
jgi:hypothetical protein